MIDLPRETIVTRAPEFNPDHALSNRMTADKLDQLFGDFERTARFWLQKQGLNAGHETECLALWLDRQLHKIRGGEAITLHHQAFA